MEGASPGAGLTGACVWVTGATGFIGQNAVRALLRAGAQVHALVRNPQALGGLPAAATVHPAPLGDYDTLSALSLAHPPTHILHAAAERGHPSDGAGRLAALHASVLGTAALLEALRDVPYARFVHLGSTLEYGPRDYPIPESEALTPVTARGVAKAAASVVAQWAARLGKPLVILRPFSVYGPWESQSRFIPTVFRALETGVPVALTRPGFHHDHIYVDDVVDACLRAMTTDTAPGEVFHLGTGVQHSNEEVVERIFALCGQRVVVNAGAHPGHPPDTAHWAADTTQCRAQLGWTPKHTLDEGLAKTLAWRGARARGDGML